MSRHNCALWNSLGFNCPGAFRERARAAAGEPDKQEIPRVAPVHDNVKSEPPKVNRFIFIRILRSVERMFKIERSMEEIKRRMEPVRARDIPIKEIARNVPIPEIIMTGAAAATIMAAYRVFGAGAERFVTDLIAQQGKGRTTTTGGRGGGTVGKGVAGTGFRFNAVDDLAGKLQELRKKKGPAGQDHDFQGILG